MAGGSIAGATPTTAITMFHGPLAATLSYEPPAEPGTGVVYDLRLAISRSGQMAYDKAVSSPHCATNCGLESTPRGIDALHLLDLEGRGEPNVIVELNTGGAHCCTIVQVFSYDPAAMVYRSTERDFGDGGAHLFPARRLGRR
jgi:hypothetical protein